jgi:uncharacterized membrane protein YphA (DoxX/SURF4 family)
MKTTIAPPNSRRFDQIDGNVSNWLYRYGVTALRISIGFVFLWFGALKFFPGLSPAEELAGRTILIMTGGLIKPAISVTILAAWESFIGLGLLTGRILRTTLLLLFAHMMGTLAPFAFFPSEMFAGGPLVLTMEGQYIVKNFVLISGAMVIGATISGGSRSIRKRNWKPVAGLVRVRTRTQSTDHVAA